MGKKNLMFIGAGVGITPFIVFLDEAINFMKKLEKMGIIDEDKYIKKIINRNECEKIIEKKKFSLLKFDFLKRKTTKFC